MSMQGNHDSDAIDAVIDATARSLTAGEPSAALRVKVRERIDHRSGAWWLTPAWGAAAAVLVAAVVVWSFLPGATNRPVPAERTLTQSVPGRAPIPDPRVQPVSVPAVVPARQLRAPVEISAAATDQTAAELESPIDPISIAPLSTRQIAVEASPVMPIEIDLLEIQPLQVGGITTPNSQLPRN